MNTRRAAYTLLEIMIVVGVIGILVAIAVPRVMKARTGAQTSTCVNNLRQIDSAKTMHAIETRKATGASIEPEVLDPYMKRPFANLQEPASGEYEVNIIGENPSCTVGGEHSLAPATTP